METITAVKKLIKPDLQLWVAVSGTQRLFFTKVSDVYDTSFTIRTLVNADNTGDSEHIWVYPHITAEAYLYITRLSATTSGTYYIYFADVSNPSNDLVDFPYAIFQNSRFYLD